MSTSISHMVFLMQAATMPHEVAPTAWQLLVSIAAVGGFMTLLVTFGIVYGRLSTRIETLEKNSQASAKTTEVELMFEEITRRLKRIEDHFDRKGV